MGDLDLNLKVPDTFFETWKEFVSCQVASSIGCFHSKKCLTADTSPLEIFFLFHLSIAPSFLFCVNDRHSVLNACFFLDQCCIFTEHIQCIADPISS